MGCSVSWRPVAMQSGSTALLRAISRQEAATARLLVHRGADVDAKDDVSYSAAEWATIQGSLPAGECLPGDSHEHISSQPQSCPKANCSHEFGRSLENWPVVF